MRDRDEIKRPQSARAGRVRRGAAKNLAQSPLGAIAHRGVADFLGRDDAETIARQIIEARKYGRVPSGHTSTLLLHHGEFVTRTQPDGRAERE